MVRVTVCCIAFRKPRRIAETSRVEEWMRIIDAGIDVANLDARACHGSATSSDPRWVGIDDEMALAQVRRVKSIILGPRHHRRGCNGRQRRSIQLHSDRVQ